MVLVYLEVLGAQLILVYPAHPACPVLLEGLVLLVYLEALEDLLILVDPTLPVGPDLLDVPVMLLLPYAHEADTVAALQAGAHDCLVKPIQPRELIARIAGALTRQKMAA